MADVSHETAAGEGEGLSHLPRNLVKAAIAAQVSAAAALPITKADRAVEAILEALKDCLVRGGRIEIRGFGVFVVRARKLGVGRNPKTGAPATLRPGRTVRFKPSQTLHFGL
jgi:DNA-binding protein HU-beta